MSNKQRVLDLLGLGGPGGDRDEERELRRELESRTRELTELRQRLDAAERRLIKKDRRIEPLRAGSAGGDGVAMMRPENVIWIFGTGRSGSTWLASMMANIGGHALWNEPLVGKLFGEFYFEDAAHKTGQFGIMGQRHLGIALKSIRSLVLEGAVARHPQVAEAGGYLVIKEPHGSVGAPLLMGALPESRMVLLVRDPRDVVSSALDGQRKESWTARGRRWRGRDRPLSRADTDPDAFARTRARVYVRDIGRSKDAYDAHEGPKALVRYEDMRAEPLNALRSIYSALGVSVDGEELVRSVEEHSWENIPEEQKGEGKFYRKATPGGWREDLTEKQVQTVEEVTANLLDEFYPGWRDEKRGGRG